MPHPRFHWQKHGKINTDKFILLNIYNIWTKSLVFFGATSRIRSLKKKSYRSKKSGMKRKAHRYEEDEEGRRCECRIKKCYEPERRDKKRHRSRKKKGKCSWLKKCLRSFFFCCKSSKRSRSCKSHVKRNSPKNCEYCCKYRDVY